MNDDVIEQKIRNRLIKAVDEDLDEQGLNLLGKKIAKIRELAAPPQN